MSLGLIKALDKAAEAEEKGVVTSSQTLKRQHEFGTQDSPSSCQTPKRTYTKFSSFGEIALKYKCAQALSKSSNNKNDKLWKTNAGATPSASNSGGGTENLPQSLASKAVIVELEPPKSMTDDKRNLLGQYTACKTCRQEYNTPRDCDSCDQCKNLPKSEGANAGKAHKLFRLRAFQVEKPVKLPGTLKFIKAAGRGLNFCSSKPYTGRSCVLRITPQKSRTRAEPPECLTISSDEEDSAQGVKLNTSLPAGMKLNDTKETTNQLNEAPKEDDPGQQIVLKRVSLNCLTVYIGSYKFVSEETVITEDHAIIRTPSVKNKDVIVNVCLKSECIMKVLYNFAKEMPVIIMYFTPDCAAQVRMTLLMKEKTGPYYDPSCGDETKRRIMLLPRDLDEVTQVALKTVFVGINRKASKNIFAEITHEIANRLLVLSRPKDAEERAVKPSQTRATTELKLKESIATICRFPPETGGITITANDLACLKEGEFLNDVIIDFYLKYIFLKRLDEQDRKRTHIFSSFFYPRLTTHPKLKYASNIEDPTLPLAQRRHNRVKNWTRTVDIFAKDFLIIPMNERFHWFLAIICFPSLVKANDKVATCSTAEEAAANADRDSTKLMETEETNEHGADVNCNSAMPITQQQPCILIFDSLGGNYYPKNAAVLREYLTVEWETRKQSTREFSKATMPCLYPSIPNQNNSSDCGLYLLQYVESFFQKPIEKYSLPIVSLKDWFQVGEVCNKRQIITEIILDLGRQQTEMST